MPAATPAKRARQRANRAARKAEDATDSDTIATTIETGPIDDPLHDTANHSSSDTSCLPAFVSPDNDEHVAIWRAATTEGFKRGLKIGVNLAEKRMQLKLEQLEDTVKKETERADQRLRLYAQAASGHGKEEGINEERARWLAVYPGTIFSDFNKEVFPETVPIAAAKPPSPVTRSIATQATPTSPDSIQFVISPPVSPLTSETSTQTESFAELPVETRVLDMSIQTGHSPIAANDLIPPIPVASPPIPLSILSALPTPQSARSDSPHGWADDFDDPYLASDFTQPSRPIPSFRARDFSDLKSSDNAWKSLQQRRGRDRRRGQRFSRHSRPHFSFSRAYRPPPTSYAYHECSFPSYDIFHPPCPCMHYYHGHAPPWTTRSSRTRFS